MIRKCLPLQLLTVINVFLGHCHCRFCSCTKPQYVMVCFLCGFHLCKLRLLQLGVILVVHHSHGRSSFKSHNPLSFPEIKYAGRAVEQKTMYWALKNSCLTGYFFASNLILRRMPIAQKYTTKLLKIAPPPWTFRYRCRPPMSPMTP